MRPCSLLPLTALSLCLIATIVPASAKLQEANARQIAKLVEQLGSDDFSEREKASADLDVLGEPALGALRQAMKSTDEEVRKRAETLVANIEKRVETVAVLKAKRIHLVYKNTPLKDALKDFAKQSGYHLMLRDMLRDSEYKLLDRPVTLDTGDASFWQAFDQFCDKAGLKEADPPASAAGGGPGVGLPAVTTVDRILLADGKADAPPTDAASAVRVQMPAKTGRADAPQTGDIPFTLQLSLEPRMQWVSVEKVTITKAIDDQQQTLVQAADPLPTAPPGAAGPGAGFIVHGGALPILGNLGDSSFHQEASFRLKEGEKYSKSLAELTGTISASILTEAAPIITAPNILKAAGKTFKGGDNGQLKVTEVSRDENDQITLRVELQAPANVVPAGGLIGRGAMRRLGRGVPVAVAPAGGVVPPGGVVAVRGALFIGGAGSSTAGLSLLDDKGEPIKLTGVQMQFTPVVAGPAGIVNRLQHMLTFQAEKGQEPSKLVYSGRKVLNLEIPFTLKDAPQP